jgi:uncharacterized protein (TIGR03083 family)
MTLDAQTYLEHLRQDGERISQVSEGHLDDPVPTCEGNTVGSLLLHVAGVCVFWAESLVANAPGEIDWSTFGTDALVGFKAAHERVVREIGSRDPDQETWTWGRDQHVRFAYRRLAQELSIHRWDFENAVGAALPIDPTLAADGVDELLEEFAPKPENFPDVKSAAERFDGDGERLRFEATDLPTVWVLTARPETFEVASDGDADVTARGTASEINLFFWGRVAPKTLDVSGDASLLDRWQERVKI